MDFQRIILYTALAFTLMMIYQAWQDDYVRPKSAPTELTTAPASSGDTPALPVASSGVESSDAPTIGGMKSGERISVETDLFSIELDTKGGDLRRADLKQYPVSQDQPDVPYRLMDDEKGIFIAQSGLLSTRDSRSPAPGTEQLYTTAAKSYKMEPGQESMEVRLSWHDASGVTVDKVYTFYRGKYLIDVRFEIHRPQSGRDTCTGSLHGPSRTAKTAC
jgi:YidC/Oxa1 family membrane protein insertase